ncbi:NAD(P)-binding protein [Aspergillus terreus]|uniref:NAD(P)-binding protein n=1 Tax=Aspergillus terreus TaxID=33178 RepID=A0A5M3Z7E1_ASPTE|nr:hypothetical protein ATETN484_0011013600 [Aspergillus terreus]GFF18773.1 NAD(P)-binding protein [Aspergillus terreus]
MKETLRVAILGPTGQIGHAILLALLTGTSHEVIQLVSPQSEEKARSVALASEQSERITTVPVDLLGSDVDHIATILDGVDVVVSALNGKALDAQGKVQDAAAKAGVRRFYPSEYGMHHVYRPDSEDDNYGYLHPIWNAKSQANERALHHPAIASGKMTYTLIGCGDFYNQPREPTWCPWTQPNASSYRITILGDPDAKVDFTNIDDLAEFLVETINHPELSENRTLNFVSDRKGYNEIAGLLETHSGRRVERHLLPVELMHRVWKNRDNIPEELRGRSVFPEDFWILVKGMQGSGRFWRPPGEVHNDLFPRVKPRTFEEYLSEMFGA